MSIVHCIPCRSIVEENEKQEKTSKFLTQQPVAVSFNSTLVDLAEILCWVFWDLLLTHIKSAVYNCVRKKACIQIPRQLRIKWEMSKTQINTTN